MREIKFRGQTDKKEWVFGSLHVGEYCWITQRSQDENKGLNPFRPIQVDPATVGQYTGLRDSKGKEIYEYDILEGDFIEGYTENWQVVIFPKAYLLGGRAKDYVNTMDKNLMVKIVGNIHDNPELLEKEA